MKKTFLKAKHFAFKIGNYAEYKLKYVQIMTMMEKSKGLTAAVHYCNFQKYLNDFEDQAK